MGVEYQEYWVKIKNKATGEIVTIMKKTPPASLKKHGLEDLPKKKDLEILDYGIVYG